VPHRAQRACARTLRRVLSALVVLTFVTITPLAYVMPPDQTWIGGFYDNADSDDVILAVMGVDAAPQSSGPVLLPRTLITEVRSSPRPTSVPSPARLTLADRSPPLS